MKYLICFVVLVINSVALAPAQAEQTTLEIAPVWSMDSSLQATFVEQHQTYYLIVKDKEGNSVSEHLVSRSSNLSDISWAHDNNHLSFVENNNRLWLLNLKTNALSLIAFNQSEQAKDSQDIPAFNVQWSPQGNWIQYLSKTPNRTSAKVYSLDRRRSFTIPVNAEQIASINWHSQESQLVVNTDDGNNVESELMVQGIKLLVNPQTQLVKAY
ncbi:hypothetical protein [Thalassotalea agarivorans]|uniref:WD40-like Beta Propeller Repeat n=1 Tax=Thalassotalea agarivorans TaxID=349064 RepID=A0A1I0FHX7_THASX|nr:hypothetical protein [Thalassotalea agarivorans]SET57041.1 hypothetical protein SAMN05660429_02116 [Thalassotalea agarivorans]